MQETSSSAFARNLNHLMHHSRTSNSEIAALLGVSPAFVSRMRHQSLSRIRFDYLDLLAAHFNVDPNTLLT